MKKRPKIFVTEPEYFTPQSLKMMGTIGSVTAKRFSRTKLLKVIRDADALVVRIETRVDKELIDLARKLGCVVSATTGLDHIDRSALKKRRIGLFSLTGTHSTSTAEHAMALLFAAARNILPAHTHLLDGSWQRWKFMGTELHGKTAGIFGIGRIGTLIAKKVLALGMKVIAVDPYVSKSEMLKRNATKVDMGTFLKESDVIFLQASIKGRKKEFFGQKQFRMMKKTPIFINTARGYLVSDKALIQALREEKIRAAAVDVYKSEPLDSRSPLRLYAKKHDNLILTPHIGASTREAMQNASLFAVESLASFFKRKTDYGSGSSQPAKIGRSNLFERRR